MCGVTDVPYRRIARELGCGLAYCQMVKDVGVLLGNEKTKRLLATADWDRPLGMQLEGREPQKLSEAARMLEGLGADVIDVNLGCPVKKVVSDGCGAALLREPEQVGRIVEAMTRAVRVPVTIKMRTGFEEKADEGLFVRVARNAWRAGAAAITVHGRTRDQMYHGFSNHDAIRTIVQAVGCPVFGNGDIRTGADATRMVQATGCHGVMVARGAMGNPWLYREVEAALAGAPPPPRPSLAARAAGLARHFELARAFYGDYLACHVIRKVIHWYSTGLPGAAELRARANHVAVPEDFQACLEHFGHAAGRPVAGADEGPALIESSRIALEQEAGR